MNIAETTPIAEAVIGEEEREQVAETPVFDDNAILDLARRRLAAKRNLIGQTLDFLLIFSGTLVMAGILDHSQRLSVAACLCLYFGVRLLVRIFKFAKPSFKDGIAAYFKKRREQKLEDEYNRLKRMGVGYISDELKQ